MAKTDKPKDDKGKNTDSLAYYKVMASKLAQDFVSLHGKLYKLTEWNGWQETTLSQLRKFVYRKHGWHPKNTELNLNTREGFEVLADLMAAPADEIPSGDISIVGKNQTLNEGRPVEGTAFRNCVVVVHEEIVRTQDGKIARDSKHNRVVYHAEFQTRTRTRNEIFYDEIPWRWLPECPVIGEAAANFTWFLSGYCYDAMAGKGLSEREHLEAANNLQTLIWIMIGSCLFDNRLQKFWVIQGEGDSGKGVLVRTIVRLLGMANIKTVDIEHLTGRFETWEMRGKKGLFLNELPPRAKTVSASRTKRNIAYGILKEIVGGDAVRMEGKYIQKQFNDRVPATVIGTTNTPTTYAQEGELGGAWERRLRVIPSPPAINEESQDHMLEQSFIGEEEAIIRYAAEQFLLAAQTRTLPSINEVSRLTAAAATSDLAPLLDMSEIGDSNDQIWYPVLRTVVASELGLAA